RRLLAARGKDDPEFWRTSSAFLVSAVVGAKASAAATTAGMGVLIMSGNAKVALGVGALMLVAAVALWVSWRAIFEDANVTVGQRRGSTAAAAIAESQPAASPLTASEDLRVKARISPAAFDPERALIGHVIDPDGAPVADATVMAYPLTGTRLIP